MLKVLEHLFIKTQFMFDSLTKVIQTASSLIENMYWYICLRIRGKGVLAKTKENEIIKRQNHKVFLQTKC